jgi:uncharacterized membrane protein YhaH (DUF805 family)
MALMYMEDSRHFTCDARFHLADRHCIWLLLFLIYFIIKLLCAIHLIPGSHLAFLVQHFPTNVSMCSLFRLGCALSRKLQNPST